MIDHNDRVKITDFGLSLFTLNGNDILKSVAGSSLFLAPEVCKGNVNYRGRQSDVWALAVTLYFMLFKKYPFIARSRDDLYLSI